MELWACGFNAWGQLSFQETPFEDTRDLNAFQCILEEETIEVVRSSVSAILGESTLNLHKDYPTSSEPFSVDVSMESQYVLSRDLAEFFLLLHSVPRLC